MAININNLNSNNTQVNQNKQAQVKEQLTQSTAKDSQLKTHSQDSVSLTPQAKQLNELQKKASDGPTVDQKKIDELKKAISAGDYKINPEKLAASLAKFEFELI
jgi:negative regulator of flagellin synthesis FlgM